MHESTKNKKSTNLRMKIILKIQIKLLENDVKKLLSKEQNLHSEKISLT